MNTEDEIRKELIQKKRHVLCDDCVQHTLDILVAEKRFALGSFALNSLSVHQLEDLTRKELLYSVHALIPGENVKEETHTFNAEYPETWLQAFKERYYPNWLKKKYPVKFKKIKETVVFKAYNLYPKFPQIRPSACQDSVQTIYKSSFRAETEE